MTTRFLIEAFSTIEFRFPSILGGHGYIDSGPISNGDGATDDGSGGLTTPWILAAGFVALITVGILVSLNPSGAVAKAKAHAAKAVILAVIVAPLLAWTVASREDGKRLLESLIVERATASNGVPELLVWLGDADLNTLATTDGQRVVYVRCTARDGRVVLVGKHPWPFANEAGFDYPHAHQPATRDQLRRVGRCYLRGTRVRLEADVKGALTR